MKYLALLLLSGLAGCHTTAEKTATLIHPTGSPCPELSAGQLERLRHEVNKNLQPHSRAIARVHTEGTLPHQGIWDQSVEAEKDWTLMRDLALLWQAEKRSEDAQVLSRLLSDWAKTYQPSFNPIDETRLDAYIDAYVIANDALDPATQQAAQQFIRGLAEGYLQQLQEGFRPHDGRWVNNWNSHRIKLAALGAAALQDKELWASARRAFIAHIERNIREDGTTLDFEERDALHYVVYDLEPLVRAAQAAQWFASEDWLTLKGSRGGSVAAALQWLEPYARGERTHDEFVHSHVRFDAQRNAAGVKGFSGLWDRENAVPLYLMAATLDTRYLDITAQRQSYDKDVTMCWKH